MLRRFLFSLFLIAGLASAEVPEWGIGPFERVDAVNPLIRPDAAAKFHDPVSGREVAWESGSTFNPAAAVHDGRLVVLYRAEDGSGAHIGGYTSRLGMATSADGRKFERGVEPVFFPAKDGQEKFEWPGGCEDPRIVSLPGGGYVMFYTQWNREVPRLGVATSPDLVHWTKRGQAFGEPFVDAPHKSAAVVAERKGDQLVARKINGKYWMYYGERVAVASSDDLIHWTPVVGGDGKPVCVLPAREGHFDSEFTESGPPAIFTDAGIVVLYNGKNRTSGGDPSVGAGAYSAGQALFDRNDPTKLLARTEKPFFKPERDFEKTGQYKDGTVFIEGLVPFEGKWRLFYGTADSFVGMAEAEL